MSSRPRPQRAHFALAFGDDVSNESAQADGKARKSAVRDAFNSPFWPFVLATTSVGQEGLDFHLYCRDIAHWNLPSNPVDLEQREAGSIATTVYLSDATSLAIFTSDDTSGNGREPLEHVFDVLTKKSHATVDLNTDCFLTGFISKMAIEGAADQSIIGGTAFYSGSKDLSAQSA
jgi:hypothetical protein